MNTQAVAQRAEDWKKESGAKGLLTQESIFAADAGLQALDPKNELRDILAEQGMLSHPVLMQAFAAFHASRKAAGDPHGRHEPQRCDGPAAAAVRGRPHVRGHGGLRRVEVPHSGSVGPQRRVYGPGRCCQGCCGAERASAE